MNITDVGHLTSDADDGEDKMLVAAEKEKQSVFEIARKYENKFFILTSDNQMFLVISRLFGYNGKKRRFLRCVLKDCFWLFCYLLFVFGHFKEIIIKI